MLSNFLIIPVVKEKIKIKLRGGSRTAATSNMECFVMIINGWKPLTVITKHSILDVAAALDPPLKLALAIPTGAPTILADELIQTPLLVARKTIKILSL